jgi:hypothetical protein
VRCERRILWVSAAALATLAPLWEQIAVGIAVAVIIALISAVAP